MSGSILESLAQRTAQEARTISPLFSDRRDAGRQLAEVLKNTDLSNAVVVAILTGGLPVAEELRRTHFLPIVCVAASKVSLPYDERFGIGTIVHNGKHVYDTDLVEFAGVSEETMAIWTSTSRKKAASKARAIPSQQQNLHILRGRTALVVDDGIASGRTIDAVIDTVNDFCPQRIIVSTPVGHEPALRNLELSGIKTVTVYRIDSPYFVVDNHYNDFSQLQ